MREHPRSYRFSLRRRLCSAAVQNSPADGEINECSDNLRNGIMIDRNSTTYNDLYEVLRQISYLAKKTQKDNVPGKTFFYSKVPILPLSDEDITRAFQSLFPHLYFGVGTQWYANIVS